METTLEVTGMTCDNCVKHVTQELTELPDVTDVQVNLNAGGTSRVAVTSNNALNEDQVRAAIDEAGYELVSMGA